MFKILITKDDLPLPVRPQIPTLSYCDSLEWAVCLLLLNLTYFYLVSKTDVTFCPGGICKLTLLITGS